MKKNVISYLIIATVFAFASCSKSETGTETEKVAQTEKQTFTTADIHVLDSIVAEAVADKSNESRVKAGLVLTASANKIGCNNFQLLATVNRQFCPVPPSTSIVAYFTLFDGSNGKILHPTPVNNGNRCIEGVQINMNYTVPKVSYLYFVMLLWDPQTRLVKGLFISNTIILRPTC
jgi:hypothetical protein